MYLEFHNQILRTMVCLASTHAMSAPALLFSEIWSCSCCLDV